MNYEDHYIVGTWNGITRYSCKVDPFDTFDLAAMKEHIDMNHGDAAPLPDVQVIRRDRFGNSIGGNQPPAPEPVVVPPAPRSKEVADDWDPHQSHEERGLPVPPLNQHAKAALRKAGVKPEGGE